MEDNSKPVNLLRETLKEKIYNLHLKEPTLRKFFRFSATELKDSPESCLEKIEQYLSQHQDKIESYSLDNWIDSETFGVVVMLEMTLTDPLSQHLFPQNLLFDLLDPEQKSLILRERIQNIMALYEWEWNTEDTRKEICHRLSTALCGIPLKDLTSLNDIGSGKMNFYVTYKDNDYSLMEYIHLIALGE